MPKELNEMTLDELWQLFPIYLTKHKDEWVQWYQEESNELSTMLTEAAPLRIHHIGSTSIPKIWAKPTIDLLAEFSTYADMKRAKSILMKNGYLCMSETSSRITLNKGYTKYGFAQRVFHIHLRLAGDHDELYFRDYLREHESIAKEYETLKLSLWKQFEHNRDAYSNAKTQFVKRYTQLAKEYYGDRYEE